MNGLHVGRWLIPTAGPMEFTYDPSWTTAPEARPLSLSLPMNLDGLPIKGDRVGSYFDNLLPDSETIRRRIRARFRTRSGEAFDLLEAIGRDCVGAVQLLPEGTVPERVYEIRADPLSEEDVERQLLAATADPSSLADDDDLDEFRISLAGAQEKTALTWHEGRWCRPRGTTPTTHIFKLPLGLVGGRQMDMSSSVENEWLCAQLLAELGVPVASCAVRTFGSTKALVVTRFDRALHSSGKYWLRLPQEDLCQATGTPAHRKYEADGGPGLVEIARVLQASDARNEDLATLLRAQLVFWALAATDGHAKNFSLRLLPRGRYRLTPLYDVISAWPIAGSRANQIHPKKLKLAMAVRGKGKHYRRVEVQRRHFNETSRQCGLGLDMEAIIADVIAKGPFAIETVGAKLPSGFALKLFESVTGGLRKALRELAKEPAA
jgi:serine/threonine-protein kinase HipA